MNDRENSVVSRVGQDVYTTELACCLDTKKEVYSLRYESYTSVNAISENEDKLFFDSYDDLPNMRTYLLRKLKKPIASMRICIYSVKFGNNPIPAFEPYYQEICNEIGLDKVIIESNKFVTDPVHEKTKTYGLLLLLFRMIGINSIIYNADYVIAAVREKHISFYKKFFFYPISDIKTYPGVNFPTRLLCLDVNKYKDKYINLFHLNHNDIELYRDLWEKQSV